ncbi:MAG: V-type ATP synthase subunit F [Clostridia bacterium]
MYLISDNMDTLTGMRMCGVNGVVVHSREDTRAALNEALENKDCGVILITEKLSADIKEEIDEIKLTMKLPLIVEIPGRHGSSRPENFITSYVTEAIGVKL